MRKPPLSWFSDRYWLEKSDAVQRIPASLTLLLAGLGSAVTVLVAAIGYATTNGSVELFGITPFVIIFGSITAAFYVWERIRYADAYSLERLGIIFVFAHFLFISAGFVDLWPYGALAPYLYGLLILCAGLLISPMAALLTWAMATLVMFASLMIMGEMSPASLRALSIPALVNALLALATFSLSAPRLKTAMQNAAGRSAAQRQRQQLKQAQSKIDELETQSEEVHAYVQLIPTISHLADNTEILSQYLNRLPKILFEGADVQFVGLFLFNEDEHYLRLHSSAGERRHSGVIQPIYLHDKHIVGEAARAGKLLTVSDNYDAPYQPHPYKQAATRSEIALPMMSQSRLLGILNIQSHIPNSFESEDVQYVLNAISQQVCSKLRQCELEDRLKSLEIIDAHLVSLNKAISTQSDINQAINITLKEISEIFPNDHVSMIRLHNDGYQYRPANHDKSHAWLGIQQQVDGRGSPIREVLRRGQAVVANQMTANIRWASRLGEAIGQPIRAWMGLPLSNGHETIGLIAIAREAPHFSKNDTNLATSVIDHANTLIGNVLHHGVHQSFNQQLEEEVRIRTIELIEAYQQLEKLDRAKVDFIQVAAHELRTPLTVLRGYTDILSREADIVTNEYHNSIVTGIASGVTRLEEIIDDMLIVSRLDNQTYIINPEPLKPHVVVSSLIRRLKPALQKRKLQIRMTNNLKEVGLIMADREAISKSFYHLLINAIKYTPDGGTITVDGKRFEKGSDPWVEFRVHDEGIGIDPQHQDLIFEKFYQTGKVSLHSSGRTQYKGGGPGIGLAIVEGFIGAHRGRVWVESERYSEEDFPGSTFHIQIPAASKMG